MTQPPLAQQIVGVLEQVVGVGIREPLHEPTFAGNESRYVGECLAAGWVSSAGPYVASFERALAAFTGCDHVLAVSNGTAALHLSLLAAGVEPGDEVMMPALTFVATANAISYCGATPHFVDVGESTLGVDPEALEARLAEVARSGPRGCVNRLTGRPIRALLAVHGFGHPPRLEKLAEICARHELALVEDAAAALGSSYRGRHAGRFGIASALSFNGNKIVTTGGGGAVFFSDAAIAKRVRHLATTARREHAWESTHDAVAYNYRLPALNAALGLAQLEQLPDFVRAKRRLARMYREAFAPVAGGAIFVEPEGAQSNYWLNLLLLERRDRELRDEILRGSHERGIGTRPAWTLMHRLPMYRDCPRADLPICESLDDRLIALPSSPRIVARRGPAALP